MAGWTFQGRTATLVQTRGLAISVNLGLSLVVGHTGPVEKQESQARDRLLDP